MNGEVQANLSFSDLKLGDRIQVDIHDPVVVALVAAKYLRIIWREPGEGMRDPAVPGPVSADGVDSGAAGLVEEKEAVDGAGEDQQDP